MAGKVLKFGNVQFIISGDMTKKPEGAKSSPPVGRVITGEEGRGNCDGLAAGCGGFVRLLGMLPYVLSHFRSGAGEEAESD